MDLKDRVIVVTGAARGIGRALARRFVSEHPKAVVVADLDGPRVEEAAAEVGATARHTGDRAHYLGIRTLPQNDVC